MDRLLNRLRRAVLQGAALAAASGHAGCNKDVAHPPTTSSHDAGDTFASADAAASVEMVAYPLERVACYGTDHGTAGPGFYGRCCVTAQCYTPSDGVCARVPASLPGVPTGSGECDCGATAGLDDEIAGHRTSIEGPYLPNPDAEPSSPGSCCYLVAAIKCDGRPLIVAGRAVIAQLSRRDDWMRFA